MPQQRPRQSFGTAKLKHHKIKTFPRTTRPGQELRLGSGWIPQAVNTIGTQSTHSGGAGTLRSGVLLWTWLAPGGAEPLHLKGGGGNIFAYYSNSQGCRTVRWVLPWIIRGKGFFGLSRWAQTPNWPHAWRATGMGGVETGSLTEGPGCNADSTSSLPTPGLLPPLQTGVHREHHARQEEKQGPAQG